MRGGTSPARRQRLAVAAGLFGALTRAALRRARSTNGPGWARWRAPAPRTCTPLTATNGAASETPGADEGSFWSFLRWRLSARSVDSDRPEDAVAPAVPTTAPSSRSPAGRPP